MGKMLCEFGGRLAHPSPTHNASIGVHNYEKCFQKQQRKQNIQDMAYKYTVISVFFKEIAQKLWKIQKQETLTRNSDKQ